MGQVVQFNKRQPQHPFVSDKPLPKQLGPAHKKQPYDRKGKPKQAWVAAIIGGCVVAGFVGLEVGPPLVGCGIKGNISRTTGERIYHVLGQEYYWATRINWLNGEQWFCSEAAAQQAGWRRSRV